MRIALIASPFISVPPSHYGGTELFIAQLAEGLQKDGFDVVVYGNGESRVGTEVRWLFEKGEWPIEGELYGNLKDINHTAWAIRDAWDYADIVHLNNIPGLAFSRFEGPEFVYTIHHPYKKDISSFYSYHPQVNYVSISDFQRKYETMPKLRTIHHGVDMSAYKLVDRKQEYLCFLGRIAPLKGTHLAIEAAKKAGIPLKIAGEIQPLYREYFDTKIKPHIDGRNVEYVGTANLAAKNELLGNALAMLFPIQWNEPFGLVMIEAMATGTPVLAFSGGAVPEIVRDGISGFICRDADDMSKRVHDLPGRFSPTRLRNYVKEFFSVERMVRDYAALYRDIVPDVKGMVSRAETSIEANLVSSGGKLLEMTGDGPLTDDPEEPAVA